MAAPVLLVGQARKVSLVPSVESRVPSSVVSAPSGAKVTEASEDLQRLLLCFEQGGGVGPHAAQSVGPLGAWGAHRVESKRGRIEKDALVLDLLDDRPLGEHVFQ